MTYRTHSIHYEYVREPVAYSTTRKMNGGSSTVSSLGTLPFSLAPRLAGCNTSSTLHLEVTSVGLEYGFSACLFGHQLEPVAVGRSQQPCCWRNAAKKPGTINDMLGPVSPVLVMRTTMVSPSFDAYVDALMKALSMLSMRPGPVPTGATARPFGWNVSASILWHILEAAP